MPAPKGKAYTVVFYVDGDSNVETYVEEVFAPDAGQAWENALRKAKRREGDRLDNATEIATFHGHGLNAY